MKKKLDFMAISATKRTVTLGEMRMEKLCSWEKLIGEIVFIFHSAMLLIGYSANTEERSLQ